MTRGGAGAAGPGADGPGRGEAARRSETRRAGALGPDAERLLRESAPRVLGAVLRRFSDFAAAEDAVAEALLAAVEQWPDGVPANPGGWLYHVACRRLADHAERERARRRRETEAAAQLEVRGAAGPAAALEAGDEDDTLELLFTCCHPALTRASAVALTLRAVGGLTTAEIASAFLVPEATMAQRISRAKQTIQESGTRFRPPTERERAQRLGEVLHVLYLIYNEGYTSSSGAHLQRVELAAEAIRLARALHRLVPGDAEAAGLLALLLLTDARRRARTGPRGELIPLAEQDRSLWDRDAIAEGTATLTAALARGAVGPYQVQAAIAALHDEAARAEDTDWPQILALYGLLQRMSDNPMVALNRAVAHAMVHGPRAGLALLRDLEADPRIAGHHRLEAVRAHLLESAGDRAAAIASYGLAASRTASLPERDYLTTKAARLGTP
jgi:RNA polymerase sigma factor (sigma-70 family)